MNHKAISLLLVMSIIQLSSNTLFAQTVDQNEARDKAIALRQQRKPHRAGEREGESEATPKLAYTSQDQKHTYFYAFNYPEGGFAIIGGDAAAREVLGFADEGTFDPDNMPEGMKELLKCYERDIAHAAERPKLATSPDELPTTPAYDPHSFFTVNPLLNTRWGQNSPYSSKLPNRAFPTGCVATAAAQVMKYYNYPTQGIGQKSFTRKVEGTTYTFEADFENTTYDWANMLDDYSTTTYTTAQADAVGTLMYHVGVANDLYYGYSSTDGFYPDCSGLQTYFGYNPNAQYVKRDDLEGYGWDQIIHNELLAHHPVFYTATADVGGHAFVIDGFEPNSATFHINWGWNGGSNGYFSLTGDGYLGTSESWSFERYQMAWIGMVPNTTNYEYQRVLGMKMDRKSAQIGVGGQIRLQADPWPANATNKTVVWSSSDTSVATVDNQGAVTAVSSGFCCIYARANEGNHAAAVCEVTVLPSGEFTIGMDDTWSSLIPYGNDDSYVTTKMLYTRDEIGASGWIKSISFMNRCTVDEYIYFSDTKQIWIGLTEQEELSASDPTLNVINLQRIFIGGEGEKEDFSYWEEYQISGFYEYDDRYNLLVIITDSVAEGERYGYETACSETEDVRCLYRVSRSDRSCASINNTTVPFEESYLRPTIKIKTITDFAGKCGTNVFWEYNKQTCNLRFYGTGASTKNADKPWYRYSSRINTVTIEEGVKTIPQNSLYSTKITSIHFPSTFTELYGSTLPRGLLTQIEVAAGNAVYSDGGGHNLLIHRATNKILYSGIENSYIPDGIVTIGDYSFVGNKAKSIILPNSVTTIGYSAFNKAALQELYIPESVRSIYYNSFVSCNDIMSVIVDKNNQTFDSRDNCNALIRTADNEIILFGKTTVIPSSVTSISKYGYFGNQDNATLYIPNNITRTNSIMNVNRSVKVVRIPTDFTSKVSEFLFDKYIDRLYVGPSASLGNYRMMQMKTLYVPQGCIEAYSSDTEWSKFEVIAEYCDPTTLAQLGTMLYTADVSTRRGEQVRVPLLLKNEQAIDGFSAKIELPVGVVPSNVSHDDPVVDFDSQRCTSNWSTEATWSGGVLTLHCQTQDDAIEPGEGIVGYLLLDITLDAQGGNQMLQLQDLSLTTASGNVALLPFVSSFAISHFLAGDVNQDGQVDQADVDGIAAHIMGNTPGRFVEQLADPNRDGKISVADVACDVEKIDY